MRSRSIATLVGLLIFAVGLAAPASAQSWKTVAKSRQLRGQQFLDVQIKYAVGHFELKRGPDRLLYRIESRFDEEAFDLTTNYLESDDRGSLRIGIDGRDDLDIGDLDDYDIDEAHLSVELSGTAPIALSMKFGAAEAELDLGGLRLQNLLLETGASDTRVTFRDRNPDVAEHCTFKAGAAQFRVEELGNSGCRRINVSGGVGSLSLDFSGKWEHDATADINVGLGTIEINVPTEVGVRIDRSTFLMSFDAPDLVKQDGGVWLSRNWDTAKRRLNLTVSGALGGIKVARS